HCHPEMPSHSFVEQLLATRKSAPISRSLRVHCALRRTHIMAAMDLMAAMDRFAFTMASLLALTLAIAAARAEEPGRPVRTSAGHVCLDQKERRAEAAAGTVIRLEAAIAAAKNRMAGSVVRARLCHGQDGLVYVLTVLACDGKVARIVVDATKGTLVGER